MVQVMTCEIPEEEARWLCINAANADTGIVIANCLVRHWDDAFPLVTNLYVCDTVRRNGLAGMILDSAIAAAKEAGRDGLDAHIHDANLASRALFAKHGFQTIGGYAPRIDIHRLYFK